MLIMDCRRTLLAMATLVLLNLVEGQLNFNNRPIGGGVNARQSNGNTGDDVGERGLLADLLGKHPLGNSNNNGNNNNNNNNSGGRGNFCCCARSSICPRVNSNNNNNNNNNNGGFEPDFGLNPRDGPTTSNGNNGKQEDDIVTRIVNNPLSDGNSASGCRFDETLCCYNRRRTVNRLSRQGQCRVSGGSSGNQNDGRWRQGCGTRAPRARNGQRCGERRFSHLGGLSRGEASPGEFPWTCLVLDSNNNFVGTCAVITESFSNDINSGTRKVITAAHKLDAVAANDLLKVRVGEYDASAFRQPPERRQHEEFVVSRITYYPEYEKQSRRFDKNMAVLTLDRRISLTSSGLNVNAACLPQCGDMFSGHQYSNGTGVRCWVAGWGKDRINGQFQPIMHKVDVPLVRDGQCQRLLTQAIAKDKGLAVAQNFRLHQSEVCAGGEAGKDACEGDGGAPLVCQSQEGLWHVVGLVTWGVDCALQNVPGVYADVFYFRNFIENN